MLTIHANSHWQHTNVHKHWNTHNTKHTDNNSPTPTHFDNTQTHTDNAPVYTATHTQHKTYKVTASAAPEGEVHKPYLSVVQGHRVGHSERSVVFL